MSSGNTSLQTVRIALKFNACNPCCKSTPPPPPSCRCTGSDCIPEGMSEYSSFTLTISNVPDSIEATNHMTYWRCPASTLLCNRTEDRHIVTTSRYTGLSALNNTYEIVKRYWVNGQWLDPGDEAIPPNICGYWHYPIIDFTFRFESETYNMLPHHTGQPCNPTYDSTSEEMTWRFRTLYAGLDAKTSAGWDYNPMYHHNHNIGRKGQMDPRHSPTPPPPLYRHRSEEWFDCAKYREEYSVNDYFHIDSADPFHFGTYPYGHFGCLLGRATPSINSDYSFIVNGVWGPGSAILHAPTPEGYDILKEDRCELGLKYLDLYTPPYGPWRSYDFYGIGEGNCGLTTDYWFTEFRITRELQINDAP